MPFHRLLFLISIAVIFALGLLMVFNTSSADILDRSLSVSTHQSVIKQLLFALLGVLLSRIVLAIGIETILRLSLFALLFVCLLLLLVFLPGLGQVRNGAHRWIGVGHNTVQPSEFAKIAVVLYLTDFLSRHKSVTFKTLCKGLGVAAVPVVLVLVEPDNGTAVILLISIVVVLFFMRVKMSYWLFPMAGVFLAAAVFAMRSSYVARRIAVYLNPELDLLGKGHQPYQAKIAAGSGGLWGIGPGHSMQKLSYLPEAQNDYIAAIFAEEFGFLGIAFLIVLYGVMCLAGFKIASRAPSHALFCLAATLTFLMGIQAFFNLGVVSGLVPSTGLNLPFFSQGGTSLMANIAICGLILAIDKCANSTLQPTT